MSKLEKCYVLFPGKFKPVHAGHLSLIESYLNNKEYDVDLTIIISRSPKEGLTPETSKWFLDQIMRKYSNVHVIISPDASPIKTAYDMAGTKKYGNGIYAMAASAKGEDIKRAEDFVDKFAEDGKYYTPGVKTIFYPVNPTPMNYLNRGNLYADTPISSTIIRQDLRNDNYDDFRSAYDGTNIPEEIIKEYFKRLSNEIIPIKNDRLNSSLSEILHTEFDNVLNEGGNSGHMEHPYEVDDFTFIDLKNLIEDLFAGKITDITEKLDGQNLWASVDNHGNTIFSRNTTTLYEQPWYLGDIMNNPKWVGNPSVQHAFSNGALTIDKVFKNIPHAADFFNYDDKANKIRYRLWLNLEIIDTQNFNVIPYVESKISFHGFKSVMFDYSDANNFTSDKSSWEIIDDINNDEHLKILQQAINKTNHTAFKAQITPDVIFKKLADGKDKAQKYVDKIDLLLNNANVSDDITIAGYKEEMLIRYLERSKLRWIDNQVLSALIGRWIYNEKGNILNIKKECKLSSGELMTAEQYIALRDFDKLQVKDLFKKIMKPLDSIFIQIGNEVLKRIDGLSNAGHEQEVVKKLSKEIRDIRFAVENGDDEKAKIKLEQSIKRLAEVNNELNATEGIVFNWKGHTMKLTGSFAPMNQLLGLKNGKFSR